MEFSFIGVDYGAKMAGTTAICYLETDKLRILSSVKNKSADDFISKAMEELKPKQVFIDAPLSLPLAYYNKGNDFHFRECDKILTAMSPMFLGGLTARAMHLNSSFPNTPFYEAYPKMVNKELGFKFYKKNIEKNITEIEQALPFVFEVKPNNWHEVDATLAFVVGYRFNKGIAKFEGNKNEGLIYY